MTFGPHPKPPPREKKKRKPMKRGKRLAPRSEKRKRLYAEERVPLVERLLRERPKCEAGPVIRRFYATMLGRRWRRCTGASTDLHEKLTRGRGGSITDEANILCVCRNCHAWIGVFPKESLALGLVLSAFPGRNPGG